MVLTKSNIMIFLTDHLDADAAENLGADLKIFTQKKPSKTVVCNVDLLTKQVKSSIFHCTEHESNKFRWLYNLTVIHPLRPGKSNYITIFTIGKISGNV